MSCACATSDDIETEFAQTIVCFLRLSRSSLRTSLARGTACCEARGTLRGTSAGAAGVPGVRALLRQPELEQPCAAPGRGRPGAPAAAMQPAQGRHAAPHQGQRGCALPGPTPPEHPAAATCVHARTALCIQLPSSSGSQPVQDTGAQVGHGLTSCNGSKLSRICQNWNFERINS